MKINSLQNQNIKSILKLYKKSERLRRNEMIIEGYREINRCLNSNWKINNLYYCPELASKKIEALIKKCNKNKEIDIKICSERVFKKISYRENPDGLVGIIKIKRSKLIDINIHDELLLIICDSIEKPGNIGSILRLADATKTDAIILINNKTDISNPNIVRSSIGSLFFIKIIESDLSTLIEWLKNNNVNSVSSVPDVGNLYTNINFNQPTAIFIGSESNGLSNEVTKVTNDKATIPMYGKNDSLNVSSAASVLLYECLRQRESK